jgi:catechol 2,3-dioxygenase-like lactoylglutathione lyase family enzyme
MMKFDNVRLLVNDYEKCFKFYTEKLGLEAAFDMNPYASFKVADGIEGLAIFSSYAMAKFLGNEDKSQPTADRFREKSEVSFSVSCVDTAYNALKAKGVEFINEPFDWECAGIRCVHFRDPESNLLSLVNGGKDATIRLESVGFLVNDFQKCLDFYTQKLGLERVYNTAVYDALRVIDGIDDALALFESDLNAETVGNADKPLPDNTFREKSMIAFSVENVDETYNALKAKGVEFINEPTDWHDAYMRVVHFYDPEGNLIELHTALAEE